MERQSDVIFNYKNIIYRITVSHVTTWVILGMGAVNERWTYIVRRLSLFESYQNDR